MPVSQLLLEYHPVEDSGSHTNAVHQALVLAVYVYNIYLMHA